MTPCKRVAKEDLINWIVTRVHRFNLTANSVKRILNVIVDPFVIKIICVFPLEVKKFRPLSKDKGRTPAKTNSFYTLTTSLAIPTYLDSDDENTDQQNELQRATNRKGTTFRFFIKSPEEGRLVRPKHRETSNRFSLCCFVIYVTISSLLLPRKVWVYGGRIQISGSRATFLLRPHIPLFFT